MRRDLEPGERAMAYAALARMRVGSNQHKVVSGDKDVPIGTSTLTRADAAEKAGVPVRTMARAMEVDRKGSPELIEAVKSGQIAVSARGHFAYTK